MKAAPMSAAAPTTATLGLLVNTWPKLSETFILEEVLGLERQGVELRLYALNAPTDALTHAAVSRVRAPVARVPASTARQDLLQRHAGAAAAAPLRYAHALFNALRRGRSGWRDFVRAGALATQLRRDGVAHLHAHFIATPADIAQLAARIAGLPFSISAHAKDIYTSRPADLRRRLAAARFTVTCTEANRRALAHRIESAGLGRHVRLAGKLAREQVLERYARATVFVQPSRIDADGDRDGIPNVLLEAMAMGLPVVASRVSGIPELVRDGINGALVAPDAPLALADAIERMLLQPAQAAAFGRAARAAVAEGFDNDINLRALLRLLEPSHAWTPPQRLRRLPPGGAASGPAEPVARRPLDEACASCGAEHSR
jgi:Glycosyl transferases group 1